MLKSIKVSNVQSKKGYSKKIHNPEISEDEIAKVIKNSG